MNNKKDASDEGAKREKNQTEPTEVELTEEELKKVAGGLMGGDNFKKTKSPFED